MTENNPVSCDDFANALSGFLERDVPESVRATLEAHALSCNDCGPLLADLRKLRLDAANMPELAPSRDLWAGIAERIETPVVEIGTRNADRGTPVRRSWVASGLAAAALVGITATTTYVLTKKSNGTAVAPAATAPAAAVATVATLTSPVVANRPTSQQASAPTSQPVNKPAAVLASNKPTAQQTYDLEIGRLRKIVDRRRGDLDSVTVAVLEKNLRIIDNAIAQCRVALRKDPASSYLNESLNDALDNKVQLLRTAAGLPSKM